MDLRAPHSAGTVPMVNARTCWLLHDGNEQYILGYRNQEVIVHMYERLPSLPTDICQIKCCELDI